MVDVNKKKINICVLVSGNGTNLQSIIDYEKAGKLNSGKIVLVCSNKSKAFGLKRAEDNNIRTCVFNSEIELIDVLRSHDIDVLVLAGFLKILTPEFIDNFKNPIINIHPSLIPSFCGKGSYGIHVHEQALERGVKYTGATVHYVNEIPDGGEIISQKVVPVLEDDTPATLQKRVMKEAEWIILPEAVESVSKKILLSK